MHQFCKRTHYIIFNKSDNEERSLSNQNNFVTYFGSWEICTCVWCLLDLVRDDWLSVSGDTITGAGEAGDGSSGSPPPSALLLLPPLMFCGGIVGQLQNNGSILNSQHKNINIKINSVKKCINHI